MNNRVEYILSKVEVQGFLFLVIENKNMIQSNLYSNIQKLNGNDLVVIIMSQMAAFQAKTDVGFDLGAQLAEKAVGQLQYEIDKLFVA